MAEGATGVDMAEGVTAGDLAEGVTGGGSAPGVGEFVCAPSSCPCCVCASRPG